jgi:hypothetical protein
MEHSKRAESFINYNFMKGKELVEKTEISHLSQENLCLCITNIITATIKMLPEIKKLVPLPILALIGLVSETFLYRRSISYDTILSSNT